MQRPEVPPPLQLLAELLPCLSLAASLNSNSESIIFFFFFAFLSFQTPDVPLRVSVAVTNTEENQLREEAGVYLFGLQVTVYP